MEDFGEIKKESVVLLGGTLARRNSKKNSYRIFSIDPQIKFLVLTNNNKKN
jgi:hypothetical protein